MAFGRKAKGIALALGGIGVAALALVWVQREPIARSMLDDTLAESRVPARYEIRQIGTRVQRLENVVLGDPARPDFTARWVEIDVGPSLSGVAVKAVRASGVRLRGELVEGTLRFGALDRLLPASDGSPFALPDLDLALDDARFVIATPMGQVGGRLDGKGNLAGGFAGKVALTAPALAAADCRVAQATAYGDIAVSNRQPRFAGPVRAANIACGGATLAGLSAVLDARMSERFDRWQGKARLLAGETEAGGYRLSQARLDADFDGNARLTGGTIRLAAAQLSGAQARAGRITADGRYRVGREAGGAVLATLEGALRATNAAPSRAAMASLMRTVPEAGGTPAGPLAAQLRTALAGLARGSDVQARFEAEQRDGRTSLLVENLTADGRSGARLAMAGSPALAMRWPGGLEAGGSARLSGGGFPQTDVRFSGQPGRVAGVATLAPYAAPGARLTATPVRFDWGRGGLSLATRIVLDGPLGTGRIAGLDIPLALKPGARPLDGCVSPSFRSASLSGLVLSPASLRTCIAGSMVRVDAPRLSGRLGEAPISLSAAQLRYDMRAGRFGVDALAVRLNGQSDAPTLLDVAQLQGSMAGGAAQGSFAGASGRIGAVPLLASQGQGNWRFAGSVLTLDGGLRVADAAQVPRFNPVVANDFALRLADDRITATATAREPQKGTALSGIRIAHTLSNGTGEALLDVPGIRFGPGLQPEQLTSITLGVIANVVGTVAGEGRIAWTPDGVTSTGTFRTDAMDFAAAFGPVTGLSGEIALSDLLGLETGPGQRVSLASVNPGIAVVDGDVRYQLLPGLKTRIEGGRWPFAGGYLILEPTVLDLSEEAERRLTFRVEGLDAARFIAALEFDNIAATGIFDGTLPMIFNKDGGRIEGGELVARGEGTLSYIGELSNEDIGLMGRFAFDALKSMKYERLTIGLSGPLDGDVVTKVAFKGVNQMPLETGRTRLPIPLKITGLDGFPFIFNITITAPFRRLFQMARTVQDPSLLVEQLQPGLERVGPATTLPPPAKPVQTPERQ